MMSKSFSFVEKGTEMPKRNTEWVIEVGSPLLRPGMKITIGPVSERYVAEEAQKAIVMVREINKQ